MFEALSGRLSLNSSSWRRGVERAESSAASFGSTATGAFDRAGEAASDSGRSARMAGSGFESLGDSLRGVSLASTMASSRVDEAGDEAATAGMQAATGAGGAGLLTTSLFGLGTASALASVSVSGLVTSLVGFVGIVTVASTLLAPLAAAAALASGAVLGLAGAFGAIMGSGLLAFNETGKGLKKTLKDLQKQLKPLIVSFGKQFVPLIKDGVNAIVPFTKAMLDALGNLEPFTDALRALGGAAFELIPKMLGLFVDVARTALPAFTQLGNFITSNLIPGLRGLFTAGQNAAGPVARLVMAVMDLAGALAPVAGFLGRVGMQLYDFIAGALQAGAALTTGFLSALRNTIQTLSRWATVIGNAVMPVITQLAGAWEGQGGRILSVAQKMFSTIGDQLLPIFRTTRDVATGAIAQISSFWNTHGSSIISIVRLLSTNLSEMLIQAMAAVSSLVQGDLMQMQTAFQDFKAAALNVWRLIWPRLKQAVIAGLSAAWQWVKGPGLSMAISALKTLASGAIAAFNFGQQHILPAIRGALTTAWNWVRTTGVSLAKQALSALATQALNALEFTREQIVPKIKTGLQMAWTWVRTSGVALAKKALGFLATQALAALEFTRENIVPKVKSGLQTAWNWVRTTGVGLAKKALGYLATQATNALEFTREQIVPKIKSGLGTAWSWVRNNGVSLAKKALGFLATQALNALEFTREQIVPKIESGLSKAWTWVRNNGTARARGALKTMAQRGSQGLRAIRRRGVPIIRTAIGRIQGAIKQAAPGLYSALKAALSGLTQLWNVTGKGWVRTIRRTVSTIIGQWRGVANALVRIIRPVLNRLSKFWKQHKADIMLVVGTLVAVVSETIRGAVNIWVGLVRGFTKLAAGLWNSFGDEFIAVVKFFTDWALSSLGGFFDTLSTLIRSTMAAVNGNWSRAWNLLAGLAERLLNGVINFVKKWGGGLVKWVGNALSGALQAFSDFAGDIIGSGGAIINSLFSDITSYIRNQAMSDVVGAFEALGRGIEGAMESAAEWAVDGFNGIMPDSFGLPEVTIPRVSMNIDPISIAGQQIYGGGSVGVGPFGPFGGQSFSVPKLDTGGFIGGGGLAMLHAGEEVVPAADVRSRDTSTTESNQPSSLSIRFDGEDVLALLRGEMVDISEDKIEEVKKDIQAEMTK